MTRETRRLAGAMALTVSCACTSLSLREGIAIAQAEAPGAVPLSAEVFPYGEEDSRGSWLGRVDDEPETYGVEDHPAFRVYLSDGEKGTSVFLKRRGGRILRVSRGRVSTRPGEEAALASWVGRVREVPCSYDEALATAASTLAGSEPVAFFTTEEDGEIVYHVLLESGRIHLDVVVGSSGTIVRTRDVADILDFFRFRVQDVGTRGGR